VSLPPSLISREEMLKVRRVRKQIRGRATRPWDQESTDLRYEPPCLASIGSLIRRIDLLLSELD
jgi:hypothetical protein